MIWLCLVALADPPVILPAPRPPPPAPQITIVFEAPTEDTAAEDWMRLFELVVRRLPDVAEEVARAADSQLVGVPNYLQIAPPPAPLLLPPSPEVQRQRAPGKIPPTP